MVLVEDWHQSIILLSIFYDFIVLGISYIKGYINFCSWTTHEESCIKIQNLK